MLFPDLPAKMTAEDIRRIRLDLKLSLKVFAYKIGLSVQHTEKLERGQVKIRTIHENSIRFVMLQERTTQ